MATRAERQNVLEAMPLKELEEFQPRWHGTWFNKNDPTKGIISMLQTLERKNLGDELDHLLDLPTDAEQQLQLQRDGVEAAKSSGHAAWLSAGCAIVAVIISVIALVVALGE